MQEETKAFRRIGDVSKLPTKDQATRGTPDTRSKLSIHYQWAAFTRADQFRSALIGSFSRLLGEGGRGSEVHNPLSARSL